MQLRCQIARVVPSARCTRVPRERFVHFDGLEPDLRTCRGCAAADAVAIYDARFRPVSELR